jgi:hypothetical protein
MDGQIDQLVGLQTEFSNASSSEENSTEDISGQLKDEDNGMSSDLLMVDTIESNVDLIENHSMDRQILKTEVDESIIGVEHVTEAISGVQNVSASITATIEQVAEDIAHIDNVDIHYTNVGAAQIPNAATMENMQNLENIQNLDDLQNMGNIENLQNMENSELMTGVEHCVEHGRQITLLQQAPQQILSGGQVADQISSVEQSVQTIPNLRDAVANMHSQINSHDLSNIDPAIAPKQELDMSYQKEEHGDVAMSDRQEYSDEESEYEPEPESPPPKAGRGRKGQQSLPNTATKSAKTPKTPLNTRTPKTPLSSVRSGRVEKNTDSPGSGGVQLKCPVEKCGQTFTGRNPRQSLWHHLKYYATRGLPDRVEFEKLHQAAHKEMKREAGKSFQTISVVMIIKTDFT